MKYPCAETHKQIKYMNIPNDNYKTINIYI